MNIEFNTLSYDKKKYEEIGLPNQSALKKLKIHPKMYIKYLERQESLKEQYDKEYLILGSMVDCAIFEPQEFYNRYAVEEEAPTGQILDFINYLLEQEEINHEKAFELVGSKKHKLEYFLNKLEEFDKYYQNRLANKGKMFVSKELYTKCNQIVNSVKSFKHFIKLCDRDAKNQELLYQKEIVFNLKGFKFKGKLDSIKIDHNDKIIYVTDLKTMFDFPILFVDKFFEYGYDFQAAFYYIGLKAYFAENNPELIDYTINGFNFIVESTMHLGCPLAFHFSGEKLEKAIKEVYSIIEDYEFYKVNGFERARVEVENDFLLTI